MKELQIVNFEQAQRLKAAGFDWDYGCGHYFIGDERLYDKMPPAPERMLFAAPTVALALKWMRDVKNKFFFVSPNGMETSYLCFLHKKGYLPYHYDTYEDAESALLDELLMF